MNDSMNLREGGPMRLLVGEHGPWERRTRRMEWNV